MIYYFYKMSGFQIDGSYKLLPIYENDISIVFDPEKGRCLIAQRDFNPGEIIIKERAFVHASYKSKAFDFPSDELKLNFVITFLLIITFKIESE